jgi:hypothetical protein
MSSLGDYLDDKLGAGKNNGVEREYFCPKCIERVGSDSSKRKLRVNLAKGAAFCHRCGYGAPTLEKLLRDLNGGRLTLAEMALLRREMRIPIEGVAEATRRVLAPTAAEKATILSPVAMPKENKPLTVLSPAGTPMWATDPTLANGITYLRDQRKVSLEVARTYDVRYCPRGHYARYLIFPVKMHKVPVYWTNRYAGERPSYVPEDKFNKSWNIPHLEGEYGKSDVLLNYDNVVGQPSVAIVEGPFDCMSMPHAVAMLGKRISERQLALLIQLARTGTREFIIALDPDAAKEADDLARLLRDVVDRVTYLPMLHGDPNSRIDEVPEMLATRTEGRALTDRIRLRLQGSK